MKKTLIIFILSMLIGLGIFSIIGSAILPNPVERNKCVDLGFTSNESTVTIMKVKYPNTTVASSNILMSQSGQSWNYTYCLTSALGYYTYEINESTGSPYQNSFLVTETSYELTTPRAIIIILTLVFLTVLSFFSFIVAFNVQQPLRLFFLSVSALLIVFTIGYLLKTIQITIGEFSSLTLGFSPIYIVGIALISVGVLALVIYSLVYALKKFNESRGFVE